MHIICKNMPNLIVPSVKAAVVRNIGKRLAVKLYRSVIGLPRATRDSVKMMGLRRTHQTVFLPITPRNVGLVVAAKELVKVDVIDRADVPARGYLKSSPGFHVVGNLLSQSHI